MPFAATNVKTRNIGGMRITTGNWTGAVGDATGTVTVQGGVAWGWHFWQNTAGAVVEAPASVAAGSAANTVTLTVENIAAVTDGRFVIFHL